MTRKRSKNREWFKSHWSLNIRVKCRTYIKSPRENLCKIAFSQDRYHPLRTLVASVANVGRADAANVTVDLLSCYH